MIPTQNHLKNSTTPTRVEGAPDLFRLGVVPDRNYRVELRVPETTDGRPANVGIIVFLGYLPYFDLGLDEG